MWNPVARLVTLALQDNQTRQNGSDPLPAAIAFSARPMSRNYVLLVGLRIEVATYSCETR